jgi:hypothetical protein
MKRQNEPRKRLKGVGLGAGFTLALLLVFLPLGQAIGQGEGVPVDEYTFVQNVSSNQIGVADPSVTGQQGSINFGNQTRRVIVTKIDGPEGTGVRLAIKDGVLTYSEDSLTVGEACTEWPQNGFVAFPQCADWENMDRFLIPVISKDWEVTLNIRVYTDAGNWSEYNLVLNTPIQPPGQVFEVLFSDFTIMAGTGVDWTSVCRIEICWEGAPLALKLEPEEALDLSLGPMTLKQKVTQDEEPPPVPTLSTWGMIALPFFMAIAAFWRIRRKNRTNRP